MNISYMLYWIILIFTLSQLQRKKGPKKKYRKKYHKAWKKDSSFKVWLEPVSKPTQGVLQSMYFL